MKPRGVPESGSGEPSYPPRTDEDYGAIGAIIDQLGVKILVLTEINGQAQTITTEGGEQQKDIRSPELDKLITKINTGTYDYTIGEAGGTQHIAILYDTNVVELESAWELSLPNIKVQSKGLFDREPLVGYFRFRRGEQKGNDIAVVGVHLASGQQNNKNHDRAMAMLQKELSAARSEGWCIPDDENDIVIMGDFNTNRFDKSVEEFWDGMEASGWDVLADSAEQYPPTRFSGVPLGLNASRIDYVLVTKGDRELGGEEVSDVQGFVHEELIGGNAEQYRKKASDHLPVTIKVKVMDDTDAARPAFARREKSGPVSTWRTTPEAKIAGEQDLQKLIDTWPKLPEAKRKAILTLVEEP